MSHDTHPSRDALSAEQAARVWCALHGLASDPKEGGESLPQIPGYEVLRLLGRGGWGDVYLARAQASSREVAIKLYPAGLGARANERVWREFDTLASLRLPAVPRILDFGSQGGRSYLVQEYIRGRTLDEACQGRTIRQRVELLARAAEAVSTVHECLVLHRDLKPSNILVDEQDRVAIIDFGIACLLDADRESTLTGKGHALGSPAYMAPEQRRGDQATVNIRSDVFGLGATGYKLLTGRPPTESVSDEAADPRAQAPDLPQGLAMALMKACDPNPRGRYESAGAFAADLRRWLAGEPMDAVAPSVWQRAVRWAGRHPLAVSTFAGVLILSVSVIATILAVRWLTSRPHAVELTRNQLEARVVSRAESILRSWKSTEPFLVAQECRGPAGERLAVIGDSDRGAGEVHSGRVCVFSFDDLDRPRWQTPVDGRELDTPAAFRPNKAEPDGARFRLGAAVVADIFPHEPGDEIVAVINDTFGSPSVVHVYSGDGRLLDSFWHDGRIQTIRWLAESGLLIMVGANNERRWRDEGAPVGGQAVLVVFGVKPQRRTSDDEPARIVGYFPRADQRRSEFYRFFSPVGLNNSSALIQLGSTRLAGHVGCELSVIVQGRRSAMIELSPDGSVAAPRLSDNITPVTSLRAVPDLDPGAITLIDEPGPLLTRVGPPAP